MMGLEWDRPYDPKWAEHLGVDLEALDLLLFQQEFPSPPRCERKRLYPLGDSRDRCYSAATHTLITNSGREQKACQLCVAAFTANMVKGEKIYIVKLR